MLKSFVIVWQLWPLTTLIKAFAQLKIPTSPILVHYQKHMHKIDFQNQLSGSYTLQR